MESEQPCYVLISTPSDMEPPNEMFLKSDLEKGDNETKIETLKKIICYIAHGERLPGLIMPIIRFIMPSQQHELKKLLLIFWEIVPKTKPDGNLLQEMILVCDAYRKDLEHPNEFIRGATLRFLCKLKEPELLEPLMTPIRNCLEHKTSYVRRNAVLAIFTIYRNFSFLIPDATELVLTFLESEKDMSCKRNAFLMLLHTDLQKAFSYLVSCLDEVITFGDILQLMVVQTMHKIIVENPQERSRFIRVIYSLLNSNSPAVRYEASGTLVTLTNVPTAVKAAASCYIDIITSEADNNIKLIVLGKLISLNGNPNNKNVLQELVMDVLRVLACSDIEVKKKTLYFVLTLTTSKTVEEVSNFLKKEIGKIKKSPEHDDAARYFQLLIKSLHLCSLRYHDVAASIVPFLLESIPSNIEVISCDIIKFIKESIHKLNFLWPIIINKLLELFLEINFMTVHRSVLWILGEYVDSAILIEKTLLQIKKGLGKMPLVEDELKLKADSRRPYDEQQDLYQGSQSLQCSSDLAKISHDERPILRKYLMHGDFFMGTVISSTLIKLAIRYKTVSDEKKHYYNFLAECTLIITSIIRLGLSGLPKNPVNSDDLDRMLFSIKVLVDQRQSVLNIFSISCRNAFSALLNSQNNEMISSGYKAKRKPINQVDDTVLFSQFISTKYDIDNDSFGKINIYQPRNGNKKKSWMEYSLEDGKVTQLTGYSDPVYAEARVQPNQYDIVLNVLIVNQTEDLLQNCTLELATLGHLKLVEKPQPCMLAPYDFCNVRAIIKVSSTENGLIFGKISYDLGGLPDKGIIVLDEIRIDIAEHLKPAPCTESLFRKMWAQFEWENKVTVSTKFTDLLEYLQHILKLTNMTCITPEKVLRGSCRFLAANFYARSTFGEDALVNVSLEKTKTVPEAQVVGRIRIRAKSQGMALYLGEMINEAQNKL